MYLALKYTILENFNIGVNLGYNRFSNNLNLKSFYMIPVTGVFELKFGYHSFQPTIALDLGVYNYNFYEKYASEKTNYIVTKTITNFGFAPSAGFNINITDKIALNTMFKYHYMYNITNPLIYFSLNMGVNIKFSERRWGYNEF